MEKLNLKFSKVWIRDPIFDLIFFLSPAFVSVLFLLIFSPQLQDLKEIPTWVWVILILGIDVSHVYSTLFRTYFHEKEWMENKTLFSLVPIVCFIIGVFVYSVSALYFWRMLAYLAVFHFIRQQFGFMRFYSRNKEDSNISRWIDQITIYLSMLYPIIYWHSHLPRNFQWFIEGDFFLGMPKILSDILLIVYLIFIVCYVTKELYITFATRTINLPKNLLLLGTGLSWYCGIVLTNNDGAFTITNVISHGIPYIALIWVYGVRTSQNEKDLLILGRIRYKIFFSLSALPLFFLLLLVLGFFEEGFWASFVWREHLELFPFFSKLPEILDKDTLNLVVPLLSLPQFTHYVLDGFIWKMRDHKAYWNHLFFQK